MDEIRKAFDKIYGDMSLSENDVAFYVFKSGWEAAMKHTHQEASDEV
jgi:deoxyxylulose-5-phosphate synthase